MEIHVNGFDTMTPVRNHLHISFGNGAFRQRASFPNRHSVATRRNVGNRELFNQIFNCLDEFNRFHGQFIHICLVAIYKIIIITALPFLI